jgi:hypothetical protein
VYIDGSLVAFCLELELSLNRLVCAEECLERTRAIIEVNFLIRSIESKIDTSISLSTSTYSDMHSKNLLTS